jgi:hypothetical protein
MCINKSNLTYVQVILEVLSGDKICIYFQDIRKIVNGGGTKRKNFITFPFYSTFVG